MRLLSIDPGACTGIALFKNGILQRADATSVDESGGWSSLYHEPGSCVCELPQVYRAGLSKGDPNDLIKVAVEVGQWKERAISAGWGFEVVKPSEWKGQVPKEIHHQRVYKVLTDLELERIPKLPASKLHNVLDAIALGLWSLKRLRR